MNRKRQIGGLLIGLLLWLLLHQGFLGLDLPGQFLGLPTVLLLEVLWVIGGVAIVLLLGRARRQIL